MKVCEKKIFLHTVVGFDYCKFCALSLLVWFLTFQFSMIRNDCRTEIRNWRHFVCFELVFGNRLKQLSFSRLKSM